MAVVKEGTKPFVETSSRYILTENLTPECEYDLVMELHVTRLRMKKLCCLCLFVLALRLLKGKLKYITKHLMCLVSFVFPRVLMFPLTSSRETLGLLGKQN